MKNRRGEKIQHPRCTICGKECKPSFYRRHVFGVFSEPRCSMKCAEEPVVDVDAQRSIAAMADRVLRGQDVGRIRGILDEMHMLIFPGEYGLGNHPMSIPLDDKAAWERLGVLHAELRERLQA